MLLIRIHNQRVGEGDWDGSASHLVVRSLVSCATAKNQDQAKYFGKSSAPQYLHLQKINTKSAAYFMVSRRFLNRYKVTSEIFKVQFSEFKKCPKLMVQLHTSGVCCVIMLDPLSACRECVFMSVCMPLLCPLFGCDNVRMCVMTCIACIVRTTIAYQTR